MKTVRNIEICGLPKVEYEHLPMPVNNIAFGDLPFLPAKPKTFIRCGFKIKLSVNMPEGEALLKFPKGQEHKNIHIINIYLGSNINGNKII